jgi:hypothetical protein
MTASEVWSMFLDTGAPEFYLLYKSLTETEDASKSA